MSHMRQRNTIAAAVLLAWVGAAGSLADEKSPKADGKKKEPTAIALADGKVLLAIPAEWEQKKPANRIIDHEFAATAAEGDADAGRFTISGAAGGVDANIERWIGQFESGAKSKREKSKVGNFEVHTLDISGRFLGSPFAKTDKEGYRMIGAIIVTEKLGTHFLKFYGPEKTIAANEKAFRSILETIKEK